MPPYENNEYELFLMNENGEPVKVERFSEMQRCEIKTDPSIDLKGLYESKYEAQFELTPESAEEIEKLQKKLNAEIVENLKHQLNSIDAVIQGLKNCTSDMVCTRCPYSSDPLDYSCTNTLLTDAVAIAAAHRRVVASGLEMMEKK